MKIQLNGYLDRNFGDDLMLRIVMNGLPQHTFYLNATREELLLPFEGMPNFRKGGGEDMQAAVTAVGSGFLVTSKRGVLYLMRDVLMGRKNPLPHATVGCNIGPYLNNFAKQLLIRQMRRNRLITVRDQASFDFLQKHLPKLRVACYPDLVFSLPQQWIPPVACEDALGISAYRREGKNNLPVYQKLARVGDDYIERTGNKVLLFAFDLEAENDIAAAYTIRSLMAHKEQVELIVHDDNGERIIRHMQRCGKVVSLRFHMAVMALRLGIPLVPVVYSEKTEGMLHQVGFDGRRFAIDTFDAQQVGEAVEQATAYPLPPWVTQQAAMHLSKLESDFLCDYQ